VLEETHYYPFGLTMAGISSNALKGANYAENRKKYNGIEHTIDLDLNQFDAFYRTLDPQIGRWWQLDPKPNDATSLYAMMENNPILNADPIGDTIIFDKSTSKQFQEAFSAAAVYLIANGQGEELAQIFFSKQEYVVKEFDGTNSMFKGNFTYDKEGNITGGNGGTILWNPSNAKESETGAKISPTTVLNHELDHASKFDSDPTGYAKGTLTPDADYGNKEEKRVITGSEQRTAKGLGEISSGQVTRKGHEFKNQILVSDPRSTTGTVINPYYNLQSIQITAPQKKKNK
jgi:RHS repeat-associated protein